MAKYFNNFPKAYYSLENKPYGLDVVTNIISRFSLEQSFKENTSIYEKYNVQDSDTPEIIASKIYDSPERHWIVLAMNDIVDPQWDWPLDYRTLISFIDDKYTVNANATSGQTGLVWAQQNTQSYYLIETRTTTKNGQYLEKKVQVDANTYANTNVSVSPSAVTLKDGNQITISTSKESKTYYDYELAENENKRQIKILKREFAFALEQELKNVFNP
jgi:hypothetical protein